MEQKAKELMRGAKNFAIYNDTQSKVREATSNDPWGPSGSQMADIAQLSYQTSAFPEIMDMIDKRLNDSGKNWRHVFKALTLLDYLLRAGHENVAKWCFANLYIIKTLKEFQYIDDKGQDQGANVREKTKTILGLLNSPTDLKTARSQRGQYEDRLRQNDLDYSSQLRHDGGRGHGSTSSRTVDDEDLQVRQAMEESKRQFEAEQRQRRQREESEVQKAIAISQQQTSSRSPDLIALDVPPSRSSGERQRSNQVTSGGVLPASDRHQGAGMDYFASLDETSAAITSAPPAPAAHGVLPYPQHAPVQGSVGPMQPLPAQFTGASQASTQGHGIDSFGFPTTSTGNSHTGSFPSHSSQHFQQPLSQQIHQQQQQQYQQQQQPSSYASDQHTSSWQAATAWTPAPNTNMPNPFERGPGASGYLSTQPTGASSTTHSAHAQQQQQLPPSTTMGSHRAAANYDRHSLFGPTGQPLSLMNGPGPTPATHTSTSSSFNRTFPEQWSIDARTSNAPQKTLNDLAVEQQRQQAQPAYYQQHYVPHGQPQPHHLSQWNSQPASAMPNSAQHAYVPSLGQAQSQHHQQQQQQQQPYAMGTPSANPF